MVGYRGTKKEDHLTKGPMTDLHVPGECLNCHEQRQMFFDGVASYKCGTVLRVTADGRAKVSRTLRCEELAKGRKAIHEVKP